MLFVSLVVFFPEEGPHTCSSTAGAVGTHLDLLLPSNLLQGICARENATLPQRDSVDLGTPHRGFVLVELRETFDAQDKAQEKQSFAQDLCQA